MEEVIKLFKKIQITNSLNDKKDIIIANKDNVLFKKCLRFLLDRNIVTGISTKKIKKEVQPSSEFVPYHLCVHSTFEDVMNYLNKTIQEKTMTYMKFKRFYTGTKKIESFMNK